MTTTRTGEIERVNRFAGSSNRNVPVTLMQHQPRIVRIDPPAARARAVPEFSLLRARRLLMPSCILALGWRLLLLAPVRLRRRLSMAREPPSHIPLYGQWFDAFQSAHRGSRSTTARSVPPTA